MPAPTSFTESTLKQFIVDELGTTGVALRLTVSSAQVTQAVYATQRLLGVSDVAAATDMATLEAAARWQAWITAWSAAAGNFDLKAGVTDLKRSQVFDHIQQRLRMADSAWYVALAVYQSANGSHPFVFATVGGRRGR